MCFLSFRLSCWFTVVKCRLWWNWLWKDFVHTRTSGFVNIDLIIICLLLILLLLLTLPVSNISLKFTFTLFWKIAPHWLHLDITVSPYLSVCFRPWFTACLYHCQLYVGIDVCIWTLMWHSTDLWRCCIWDLGRCVLVYEEIVSDYPKAVANLWECTLECVLLLM